MTSDPNQRTKVLEISMYPLLRWSKINN